MSKQTVTAHSGCMKTPDNSLDSIAAGVKAGADIVEIDIRSDGRDEIFLSHNDLKSGVFYLSLDDVFRYVSLFDSLKINVDVKQTQNIEQVEATAKKYGLIGRVFFTGVADSDVPLLKKECPEIPYYLTAGYKTKELKKSEILNARMKKIKELGGIGINLNQKQLSAELITAAHDAGLEVSVWTVSKPKEMKKVIPLNPDNITTREPAALIAMKKKLC